MLADKIIRSAGGFIDTQGMFGGLAAMAADIQKSQIFAFDEAATSACSQLAKSRPSSLLEATKFCRVPFKSMWVEWPMSGLVRDEFAEHWSDEHKALVHVPGRMGCLIRCLDETSKRFGLAFVWDVPAETYDRLRKQGCPEAEIKDGVNLCPFGFIVNWHDGWMPKDLASVISDIRTRGEQELVLCGDRKKYANDQAEMRAIRELLANRVPCEVPYSQAMISEVVKRGGYSGVEKLQRASAHDLEGEYENVIAMLCMLNTRNCVTTTQPDLSKINKARRKRGETPLISHSVVSINLSRRDAKVAASGAVRPGDVRQHLVRGHFKIRKGGVFWWRPFLRGDPALGEVVRDSYQVTSAPRAA